MFCIALELGRILSSLPPIPLNEVVMVACPGDDKRAFRRAINACGAGGALRSYRVVFDLARFGANNDVEHFVSLRFCVRYLVRNDIVIIEGVD